MSHQSQLFNKKTIFLRKRYLRGTDLCSKPQPQYYSDSPLLHITQRALHSPSSPSLRNSSLHHFVKHLNHTRTSSLSSCFVLLLQQPCCSASHFPCFFSNHYSKQRKHQKSLYGFPSNAISQKSDPSLNTNTNSYSQNLGH